MPYISQDLRLIIDSELSGIQTVLDDLNEDEIEGALNYTITSILDTIAVTESGNFTWRYKFINRIMGVLECVKMEFYRRLASPYENSAIAKNGDIKIYDTFIKSTKSS